MPIRPDIDRDLLAGSYRAGASLVELAQRYGADHRTIKRILERAGVTLRTAAQTKRMKAAHRSLHYRHPREPEILAAYANGIPARDISQTLGIHHAHLIRVLKRNGVTPRTRAEGKALQMRRLTFEERAAITARARQGLQAMRNAGWVRPDKGKGKRKP